MEHVVVIGVGAIGSHLVPHLARSPGVSRVTIVDRARYDAGNTRSQNIDVRDVGRPKARVQARRLRRINPALEVAAICAPVERVPLGALGGGLILAALGSRRARMVVNQAAWRLSVPWIDAGVHADGMLARVRVFAPSADAPCLECGWTEDDYDALDLQYPCAPGVRPGSTGASAALAALAAALQAAECDRLLSADDPHAMVGREVLIGVRRHCHSVSTFRRNPACRMPDHGGWRIGALGVSPDRTSLADVLALGSTLRGASVSLAVGVAGQRIATALRCDGCGARHATWLTERVARASRTRCPHCGGRRRATGFDLQSFASAAAAPDDLRGRSLADIGVRPHDVLTFRTPDLDAHFEVGRS
jgi:molybdopterin/thiamine biosynthesis adenylyltransferase